MAAAARTSYYYTPSLFYNLGGTLPEAVEAVGGAHTQPHGRKGEERPAGARRP
jgi:hypothetical protein